MGGERLLPHLDASYRDISPPALPPKVCFCTEGIVKIPSVITLTCNYFFFNRDVLPTGYGCCYHRFSADTMSPDLYEMCLIVWPQLKPVGKATCTVSC